MYQRIRDLREDQDLTQKQLSEILHCSQQVYSNYELGQRDIPTQVLIALADFYGTTTDYILGPVSYTHLEPVGRCVGLDRPARVFTGIPVAFDMQ